MNTTVIKAAIVDDEMHCIKTLRFLIEKNFKEIEIVFATTDSTEAKTFIETHQPDLLFLDIEMPVLNGLQLLQQLNTISFKVVFTTAYDQYAIKAIRLHALDYLLKPISKPELENAIEAFKQERNKTTKEQISHLHLFTEKKITDTIALSSAQGLFFVKLSEILYFEADNNYTHVVMQDGNKFIVSKTLSNFMEIIEDDAYFFRAQKSYIINLRYIKKYIRGEGGEIVMTDLKHIALSRNNKDEFLKLFSKV